MCFAETHQCALLEFRTHNNNKWRKQESARRQWLILHMYVVASGEAKAIEYYTVIQQWERSIDIVAEERFLVLLSPRLRMFWYRIGTPLVLKRLFFMAQTHLSLSIWKFVFFNDNCYNTWQKRLNLVCLPQNNMIVIFWGRQQISENSSRATFCSVCSA